MPVSVGKQGETKKKKKEHPSCRWDKDFMKKGGKKEF